VAQEPAISAFRLDDGGLKSLYNQWRALAAAYTNEEAAVDAAFKSLSDLYSAEGRFYHNLSHVESLLALARELKKTVVDYDSVQFSIWFHDAVYDTRRTDNEERSADLAEESLTKLRVPAKTISAVREMILATKQHGDAPGPPDLPIFLDLDLSILGAPDAVYTRYAAAIRKEYSWVPEPLYKQGRANILKGFLGRDFVFLTEAARKKFERPARINLQRELSRQQCV
jgi:predicted metal-dependent HD superfamily phosphohydrolase